MIAVLFAASLTAAEIVQRFADAWRGDAEMRLSEPVVMGLRVAGDGGGAFTVTLKPGAAAIVEEGVRDSVDATLVTDVETLRRIDRGELSAMTAMARARMSDPAPMSVEFPPGFRWTPAAQALYLPLAFHFFTRGTPEVVPFGEAASVAVHGARSTILYYDRGLRTSWYELTPGMHINADPRDRSNPFRSLVVVTRGAMHARIGGVERPLREGEAVLVPEGVEHEFWAAAGESAEFILVMFGDKA